MSPLRIFRHSQTLNRIYVMAKKKDAEEKKEETAEAATGAGQQKPEEVDVPIDQVKMAEDEALRIVITKSKDNSLSILVKTHEGENVHEVSFFEVVGVLETAKSDMLNQQNGQAGPDPMQLVPITLEQEDFELDADGRLAASGKKVGDIIQVPLQVAQLREMSIQNLRRRKATEDGEGGPTHMSVIGGADSEEKSEE